LQAVVIGLSLGGSFYRLQGTPTDIQSLKTLCYQYEAVFFYLTIVYSIYRYCNELVVFDRERADHLYKPVPWILSEVAANLSINMFFPALYAIILYFMAGMRTDDLAENVLIFIATVILVQLGSVGFALLSASMVREFASASLMANGISIFFFLSAGYALLQPPVYVNWIRFINVFWYGFRIVAISQFRGRVFSCEGVTGLAANQCKGDQVLAGLLIPVTDPLWKYFVSLTGVVISFNVLATILLAVGSCPLALKVTEIEIDRPAVLAPRWCQACR
jgi:ABC-2 type transporter